MSDDLTLETKITKDGSVTTTWKKNGKIHRDNGLPAVVFKQGSFCRCEWFIDGKNYRKDNKPTTVELENNKLIMELWEVDGQLHRENGPARQTYHRNGSIECIVYFKNDEMHREDGPAFLCFDKNRRKKIEEYYENGIYLKIAVNYPIRLLTIAMDVFKLKIG